MTKIKTTTAILVAVGAMFVGLGAIARHMGGATLAASVGDEPRAGDRPEAAASPAAAARLLREAFAVVSAVEDAPSRVYTLIAIAKAQANLGERATALATLEFAAPVAETLKPGDRAIALGAVAYAHWEAGDRAAIPELLRRASDDADHVDDVNAKLGVLNGVGTAQSWTGDVASARETVRRMRGIVEAAPPRESRFLSLMHVVELQAMIGDFDDAFAVVDSFSTNHEKDTLLGWIAAVAASANHYFLQPPRELTPDQKATRLEVVRRIVRDRPSPPVEVAMALADLGQTDEALRLIRPPQDASGRRTRGDTTMPWVLTRIGIAQAKSGQAAAARKTFQEALDGISAPDTSSRLQLLASGQASSGDVEGALRTARLIEPWWGGRTLIQIADAQSSRGDRAGATETLRRALEHARTCLARPPQGKPGTLGANSVFWRSRALMEIAMAQAKLGDFPAALEAAKQIPTPDRRGEAVRGEALSEVAKAQARSGKAEEAWAWVTRLEAPNDRTCAIRGLAEGIAAAQAPPQPTPARR